MLLLKTALASVVLSILIACGNDSGNPTANEDNQSSSIKSGSSNQGVSLGKLVDDRDGQIYKTVKIG